MNQRFTLVPKFMMPLSYGVLSLKVLPQYTEASLIHLRNEDYGKDCGFRKSLNPFLAFVSLTRGLFFVFCAFDPVSVRECWNCVYVSDSVKVFYFSLNKF